MSYKYDVFLSYSHDLIEEWVRNQFLTLFRFHLEGALGKRPIIFIDREGIKTGDTWPLRLKSALAQSKCLVGVWSPTYFDSEWCIKECSMMRNREQEEGYRTIQKPSGLILPINICDGQSFPDFAKQIQYKDFRDFAIVGKGFELTELYVQFQQNIRNWSADVAKAIQSAPKWKNKWINDPVLEINNSDTPKFEQPILEY